MLHESSAHTPSRRNRSRSPARARTPDPPARSVDNDGGAAGVGALFVAPMIDVSLSLGGRQQPSDRTSEMTVHFLSCNGGVERARSSLSHNGRRNLPHSVPPPALPRSTQEVGPTLFLRLRIDGSLGDTDLQGPPAPAQ
jgi:hypothetical protein